MVLRHGEDRHLVFLLPRLDDLRLALAALHHERRGAMRMDQVAVDFGELRDRLLVMRHHGLEFIFGAAPDVEKHRNARDALRQQSDHLLGHAGPHGRVDHADNAAPTCKRHAQPLGDQAAWLSRISSKALQAVSLSSSWLTYEAVYS